jgi:hypothetical protein
MTLIQQLDQISTVFLDQPTTLEVNLEVLYGKFLANRFPGNTPSIRAILRGYWFVRLTGSIPANEPAVMFAPQGDTPCRSMNCRQP